MFPRKLKTIPNGTNVCIQRRIDCPLFQSKTLHHNITQGIIISNQSLVLQGVDRKSAGNYTCVGYNTEGDGESSPFYLNVMCTCHRFE